MKFFIDLKSHFSHLETYKFITRKTFLRLAIFGLIGLFVGLWDALVKKQHSLVSKKTIARINMDKLFVGVHFIGDFIVVKDNSGFRIFSSRCTHAGCKISREINGKLICPCHGSEFESVTGKVLKGPAGLSLAQIPFETDPKTGEIIIKNLFL